MARLWMSVGILAAAVTVSWSVGCGGGGGGCESMSSTLCQRMCECGATDGCRSFDTADSTATLTQYADQNACESAGSTGCAAAVAFGVVIDYDACTQKASAAACADYSGGGKALDFGTCD